MKKLQFEDYRSNLFYRVKHVAGENTSDFTRKDYHNSENIIFILFMEGVGRININGSVYEINSGDLLKITPGYFFLLSVENDKFHERIVLIVNPKRLKHFYEEYGDTFSPLYENGQRDNCLIPAQTVKQYGLDELFLQLLEAVSDKSEFGVPLAASKTIEILCKTKKLAQNMSISFLDSSTNDSQIADILEYLRYHYKENISVQEIADHFNMNRSYLLHKFQKCVGMSLWNYVILRRIYAFNNSMTEGSSVEQVAYSVGFSNYSNFFKLYKKNMGITPLEFKKQFCNTVKRRR